MKEKIKHILNKKWALESLEKLSKIVVGFRISEKFVFYGLVTIFVISGLSIVEHMNRSLSINVPTNGGSLTEGIVGSPRFINPVLAVSDVDRDLTELIYSGLMKVSSNGKLVPDLAESYMVSADGLTYDFILKDNVYFSDGVKVTADDIGFTINEIQDSTVKSPERPEFYDVTFQKINDREVKFVLKQPYASFLENLTVGILPKHIWNNLNADQFALSQYNVEPIGSGPYKISKMQTLQKNMLIIPTYYELTPFDKYALGEPFIDKLIINFYSDEKTLVDAYNKGAIESMNSIDPDQAEMIKKQKNTIIDTSPLPRTFAVFFNQNESDVLADKSVREALNMSVNRQQIVNQVLGGYGKPIYGPIPAGFLDTASSSIDNYDPTTAANLLLKDGWVKSTTTGILSKKVSSKKTLELDVSISTLNSPDLVAATNLVKADWEAIGANVDIKQFELGDLQQNVIRPRKFDALLYGVVVGRDMDFFAFWDSSQRNDPGLNISMYTNSSVDKLLEDARKTTDTATQTKDYISFESDVEADVPAVFLYSPEFIYAVPNKVQGLTLGMITQPYERFLDVNKWYIETNNIWKIFADTK